MDTLRRFSSPSELRRFWDEFLTNFANATEKEAAEYQKKLQLYIFHYGLPEETEEERKLQATVGKLSIRGEVWRILLRIQDINDSKYKSLVQLQNSELYPKIKGDTNRTFSQDAEFSRRVSEDQLIRVLNAFQQYQAEKQEKLEAEAKPGTEGTVHQKLYYSQGMNLFAGIFLYVLPEPLAFWAFTKFMEEMCPRYGGSIEGAKEGLMLFEQVFKVLDPELYNFMQQIDAKNETYAYHSIISLMTSVPPLQEALKLFDVMLAWGVHLSIVFAVCNLILRRREFLDSREPKKLLMYRSGGSSPPLNARAVLNLSWQLLPKIPDELFRRLVYHPIKPVFDDTNSVF